MTAKDLIKQLNLTDECTWIEAKKGSSIDRSLMETICAFCNESGLDKSQPVVNSPRRSEPVQASSEPVHVDLVNQLPKNIQEQLSVFQGSNPDNEAREDFICDLCFSKELSIGRLSRLLNKGEKYLLFNFIKPLRDAKKLEYTIPEMLKPSASSL